jgi:hypothetical protein
VAEIGRQQRESGSYVSIIITVTIKNGANGEGVAQVVESGATRGRARLETGSAYELTERALGVGVEESGARSGDEQRGSTGSRWRSVASAQIVADSVHGTRLQRQLARLAELALVHNDQAIAGLLT